MAAKKLKEEILTAELALRLGQVLGLRHKNGRTRKVLIGKEPRRANYMLETAFMAGFTSAGMSVEVTGPLPTSAVAMLVKSMRCDLGVMITGEGVPSGNGPKIFTLDGELSPSEIRKIEEEVCESLPRTLIDVVPGPAHRIEGAQGRYVQYATGTVPELRLEGIRVIVDCANGAAYEVAPQALRELSAEVFSVNIEPDGFNIDLLCGFNDISLLRKQVHKYRADFGLAFRGDGYQFRAIARDGLEVCVEEEESKVPPEERGLVSALRLLQATF